LPSGDSFGGISDESDPDPLGLGFLCGGGDLVPDVLGLRLPVVGVGDDGAVGVQANGPRSIAPPFPSGCSEATTWHVPEPKLVGPATVKEVTPSSGLANGPRSTNPVLGV
jgi:hypothetical protein